MPMTANQVPVPSFGCVAGSTAARGSALLAVLSVLACGSSKGEVVPERRTTPTPAPPASYIVDRRPPSDLSRPFRGKVRELVGVDLAVLESGVKVRLQGISLPTASVRPSDCVDRLRFRLSELLAPGYLKDVWFFPDGSLEPDDEADVVACVRSTPSGQSFNALVVAEGLAVANCRTAEVVELGPLMRAARRAQTRRVGWWSAVEKRARRTMPFLNGAVLGLHARGSVGDYDQHLDELADLGFRHVCLTFPGFLENVSSHRIDRHGPRTVSDRVLIETIEGARRRGMTILLLPIVLLRDDGDDDWRGVLRPTDEQRFWIAYDRFLAHYLDIAESTGVEMFSIGSEFSSLEDRHQTWERLIANARARYTGMLTYSANWDHVSTAKWFGGLDFVGMTAYFSLTDKRDPTFDELVAAWNDRAESLQRDLARLGRPVVFTEIGYCSQDGANTDPWNYVMNREDVDLREQADCFAAFAQSLPSLPALHGAYFFEYFDRGGPRDSGYSPRGKPALDVWRDWAGMRHDDRRITPLDR